jgi:hypothetical protein
LNLPTPTIQAIKDHSLLLGKGYPDKRTLELISDTYKLDRHGRAILYRGVFKKEVVIKRRAKLLTGDPPEKALLKVDVLNQFYSIVSYLSGQVVFIASDGLLRDASGYHGEIPERRIADRAIQEMVLFIESRRDLRVELFLDRQVDACAPVGAALEAEIANRFPQVKIVRSDRVDAELSSDEGFLLATSDSAIVDRTLNRVFDLARKILERKFSGKIPDIGEILSENK